MQYDISLRMGRTWEQGWHESVNLYNILHQLGCQHQHPCQSKAALCQVTQESLSDEGNSIHPGVLQDFDKLNLPH